MNSKTEWRIVERMMLGDFSFVKDYNDNHDPDNGQFTTGGGSSHKAKVTIPKAVVKATSVNENRIRNEKVEHGICCDKDGNELFHAISKSATELDLTPDEKKMLKEAYLTHNHGSGKTFSPGDVHVALENGARQFRACHKDGAYVLTRQYDLKDQTFEQKVFDVRYLKVFNEYLDDAKKKWRASSNKTEALDLKLRYEMADKCHDWLKKHAEEYGWEYKTE
jgi:hypothetical protein